MKNLVAGILALGLIIWPLVALGTVWSDQASPQARLKLLTPLEISWVIGSLISIYGIFYRTDGSAKLRSFGRALCIGSLLIEAGIVAYGLLRILTEFSRFGVN
jgi:hypothetical protein